MKTALTAGGLALAILGLWMFLRPSARPLAHPSPDPIPMPAAMGESAVPASAPALAASPTVAGSRFDRSELLRALAKALRSGDRDRAREIVRSIRERLLAPIPDERNGAVLYRQAFALLKTLEHRDQLSTLYGVLSAPALSEDQRRSLGEWFRSNEAVASELSRLAREAANRPECRFVTGDGDPLSTSASLVESQRLAQVLQLRARLSLEEGRPLDAAVDLRTSLGVGRAVRSDPILISQLIGVAIDDLSFKTLQTLPEGSSSQMTAITAGFDAADIRNRFADSLVGDICLCAVEPLLRPDAEALPQGNGNGAPPSMQDLGVYVEAMAEFIRLGQLPYGEVGSELDAIGRQYGELAPAYAAESKEIIPTIRKLIDSAGQAQVRYSLLQVAAALERAKAEGGSYPVWLEGAGKNLPTDPFSNRPFTYRREGSGFVLESEGRITFRRP